MEVFPVPESGPPLPADCSPPMAAPAKPVSTGPEPARRAGRAACCWDPSPAGGPAEPAKPAPGCLPCGAASAVWRGLRAAPAGGGRDLVNARAPAGRTSERTAAGGRPGPADDNLGQLEAGGRKLSFCEV